MEPSATLQLPLCSTHVANPIVTKKIRLIRVEISRYRREITKKAKKKKKP